MLYIFLYQFVVFHALNVNCTQTHEIHDAIIVSLIKRNISKKLPQTPNTSRDKERIEKEYFQFHKVKQLRCS